MSVFARRANWFTSALVATLIHAGLLFAFVDHMNAGAAPTTETEITILDLPPTANTAALTANKMQAILPEKDTLLAPTVPAQQDRLANLTSDAQSTTDASRFDKAMAIETDQSSTISSFSKNEIVAPSSSFEPLQKTNDGQTVEKTKADDADLVQDPATKIRGTTTRNSKSPAIPKAEKIQAIPPEENVPLAPTAPAHKNRLAKPVQNPGTKVPRTTTKNSKPVKYSEQVANPVASVIEAKSIRAIASTPIKAPPPSPVLTAPIQTTGKKATIAKPVDRVELQAPEPTKRTKLLQTARPDAIDHIENLITKVEKTRPQKLTIAKLRANTAASRPEVTSSAVIKPTITRPTIARPLTARPQKSSFKSARSTPEKTRHASAHIAQTQKVAPNTHARAAIPAVNDISKSDVRIKQNAKRRRARPAEKIIKTVKLSVAVPVHTIPPKKKRVMKIVNIKPQAEVPRRSGTKLTMRTRLDQVQGQPQESELKAAAARYGKILNFLKFNRIDDCFIALPTISENGWIELYGISTNQNLWRKFQSNLVRDTNIKVPGDMATISQAQCQVVSFARRSGSYPSFSLALTLQEHNIRSGEFLIGNLHNVRGRYLNLLLVDDEGVAQRINNYISIDRVTSQFRLQINQIGSVVRTSQLLLAIVTNEKLASATDQKPARVVDLLAKIEQEIVARNLKLDLAIAAFTIR